MKICSLYGAGFYYIPGTDTCLKVGGWVRFETGYGYNGSFTTEWFRGNANNRTTDENNWRVKGVISFDAREQTAYGTLRSYAALGVSNNNNGDNAIVANYANRWFIQWAGFTIGHATSFFDFYSIGGNQYGFVNASSDTGDGGWDVFGYTAQFGNGFSASLAAEVQRRTQIVNATVGERGDSLVGTVFRGGRPAQGLDTTGTNITGRNYAGHNVPDLVANLRIDQAWGSAQVMGALHNVAHNYYGSVPIEVNGHASDKLGWAVGAGLRLNAPMIGRGDYFQAQVTYTKGASRYSDHTALAFDKTKFDGSTVGYGVESDAVVGGTIAGANNSGLELTTTWAINAAFTHNWTPALKSTLWGAYREVNYNSRANAMLCSNQGFGNGVNSATGTVGVGSGTDAIAGAGCNNDWSSWGFGLRSEWAATKNLSIGLEVLYAELNSAQSGTGAYGLGLISGVPGKPTSKPAGAYTIADQDQIAIRFRATRTFYP